MCQEICHCYKILYLQFCDQMNGFILVESLKKLKIQVNTLKSLQKLLLQKSVFHRLITLAVISVPSSQISIL